MGRIEAGLYDRLSRAAERFGERTAIEVQRRDGLESWTYERLGRRAEELASRLAMEGVGHGDRCALLAENDAHWIAAFLALLRLGAVPVPLDTTYTAAQVATLVSDCEARLLVASRRFHETAGEARELAAVSCPVFALHDETAVGRAGSASPPPAATIDPNDPAAILYTSGTTSDPKGVVLTHGNLLGEIDAALHEITIVEGDAVLAVLPLFHVLAQVANFLIPLSVGARVVFLETLSTTDLLRALQEREISVFCCVPQFYYLIHQRVLEKVAASSRPRRAVFRLLLGLAGVLRERLGINLGPRLFAPIHRALGPRMRLLVTGGSRFDPRVGRDLYRLGFNILQAYGLTETSGGATILRPGDRRVASVGQALPGVELKILPGDGADGIGEIAVRGPIVSPGYFRRDDVNAEAYRDGWFHTGDLGYLDADGRLYVTGRAKEVIVLGSGKNIYPEEVESHYARSPFIKELCVLGRSDPDAPASERLHAIVVPDFDVMRERKIINAREILRFEIANLSTELPGHKRILSYDVVSQDLPRTTTRKLKRFEIQERFEAESAAASGGEAAARPADDATHRSWSANPHVSRILQALRAAAPTAGTIGPESNLELDLGLDSMGRVELLASLEQGFGISVPEQVAHDILTVGQLVEVIRPEGDPLDVETSTDLDPWPKLLGEVSSDDPAVASILAVRPWVSRLVFAACKVLYAVAWLLLGLRVSGRKHLPQDGPFLISPNHQSFLDGFLLASTLPFCVARDVFYVGASEYFESPLGVWFARMIHLVPVDPDTNLVGAMRAGAHGLRRGRVLILFPEGERSIDSEIKTFKKGAAILAVNVPAPIVPVALDGTFDIWPRAGRLRLVKLLPFSGARVHIRFGAPLEPQVEDGGADPGYSRLTERLRREIGRLLEAVRRG